VNANKIQVGDIIKCEEFCLMLYPTQGVAARAAAAVGAIPSAATAVGLGGGRSAAAWSAHLGCSISYVENGSPLFVIENDGQYFKVLATGDKSGWIIYQDWLKLEICQSLSGRD
jgi:hypothetical protein